jgi:hypothetical protein
MSSWITFLETKLSLIGFLLNENKCNFNIFHYPDYSLQRNLLHIVKAGLLFLTLAGINFLIC